MKNFEEEKLPLEFLNVTEIVFGGRRNGSNFWLKVVEKKNHKSEESYSFGCAPDIFFRHLPIKEVYYEPYRTFLRFEEPTAVRINWMEEGSDKLIVRGVNKKFSKS